MILEWLVSVDNWWLILALLLAAGEVIVPGVFLLWIALAMAAVGLIHIFFSLGWQVEMFMAAILSPMSLWIGFRIMRQSGESTHPLLNRRAHRYLDRVVTLDQPFENGFGKVRIDDTVWKIRGEGNLPTGQKVRITGSKGAALLIEPEKDAS